MDGEQQQQYASLLFANHHHVGGGHSQHVAAFHQHQAQSPPSALSDATGSTYDAYSLMGTPDGLSPMQGHNVLQYPIQMPLTPHTPSRPQDTMVDAGQSNLSLPPGHGDAQKMSSIGPTRPLTRRRTRLLAAAAAAAGSEGSASVHVVDANPIMNVAQNAFYVPDTASRPQTPARVSSTSYHLRQRNAMRPSSLSLAPPLPLTPHLISPSYPSTPASATSTFSHFSFQQGHHSRSTSGSASLPRAASPTPSNASVLTSLSSGGASASTNSQAYGFSPYQLPTPITGSPVATPNIRAKQRKQRLTPADRKAICVYQSEHPHARQEDVAARFNVERSTVSKIWSNRQKWLGFDSREEPSKAPPKDRTSKFPEVEAKIEAWLHENTTEQISDALIREKARMFATEAGISATSFKASAGWVENLKRRLGIRHGRFRKPDHLMDIATAGPSLTPPANPLQDQPLPNLCSEPANSMLLEFTGLDAFTPSFQSPVPMDGLRTPMQLITDMDGMISTPDQGSAFVAADSAEASMRTVLEYVSSQPDSVISQEERDSLLRVHQVLTNARSQEVDYTQDHPFLSLPDHVT